MSHLHFASSPHSALAFNSNKLKTMLVVKAGRISVNEVAVGIVVEFNFGVQLDSLFVM